MCLARDSEQEPMALIAVTFQLSYLDETSRQNKQQVKKIQHIDVHLPDFILSSYIK